MEWLSSNWIWLALGVGFIFFVMGRGGCGMGHGGHQDHQSQAPRDTASSPGQSAFAGEHAGHGSSVAPAGTAQAQRRRHGC